MRSAGFTVTELAILIVILVIVAAILLPHLLHSRLVANEAAAISSLRTISRAEASYHAAYPSLGFASQLADLGGPSPCKPSSTSACLIDPLLAGGVKSGYNFAAAGTNRLPNDIYTDYTAGAAPLVYNDTGIRLFCVMSDAVIRFSSNQDRATAPPDTAQCHNQMPVD